MIRAITKVIGADWDTVYVLICAEGFLLKELPPTDNVWNRWNRHGIGTEYYYN